MGDWTTDHWALVVAIAAAGISLSSALWQFALYRLSGWRLRVRLRPAMATPDGFEWGRDKGWKKPRALDVGEVELALLEVTNIGRSPVSVENLAVDFGRALWKPWSRKTLSTHPLPQWSTGISRVVRLEPGETWREVWDLRALLGAARHEHPDDMSFDLRGSATPAGRRPRRSKWRYRWRFDRFDEGFARPKDPAEYEPFYVYWAHLIRREGREGVEAHRDLTAAWFDVRAAAMADGACVDSVRQVLEPITGRPGERAVALEILNARADFLGEGDDQPAAR